MKLDKTSEVWQRAFPRCVIIDPDGWDRNNFRYSFYEEKISLEEYNNRLLKSTIEILPAEKRKHLIQDEDFKNKLVELGFKDLGSGWFENEDNYIRIRIWKEYSVDFWLWKNKEDNQIHFRGDIYCIDDVRWVLKRCFNIDVPC